MHVAKLRIRDEQGLVPAGRYFERLAANLRKANARDAARRERDVAQERALEGRRRLAPDGRASTFAHSANHSARL